MPDVAIKKCPTCGRTFEVTIGRRGQPQVYCDQDCKELPARLAQLDRLLPVMRQRMGDEQVRTTRSSIQRAANQLNRHMPRSGRHTTKEERNKR